MIRPALAVLEWLLLGAVGIALACLLNPYFAASGIALWGMGLVYNVPPLRSKELPYVDVLSESINNPLRPFLGWFALIPNKVPPLSLTLAYWMVGAFLMAMKRFAEYRHIGNREVAAHYRKSFGHYTENRLLVSILFYATFSALFSGIFIIRYHVELILFVPVAAGFFAYYFHLGLQDNSPVQNMAVCIARRLGQSPWLAGAAVLGGGVVAPLLVFGWLAWVGGLGAFVERFRNYVIPFYGSMGVDTGRLWMQIGLSVFGWRAFAFVAFLALQGLMAGLPEEHGMRRFMGLVGVAYGVLHYHQQHKGFPYHVYPLLAFLLVTMVPALRRQTGSATSLGRELRELTAPLAPFFPLQLALLLSAAGLKNLHGRDIAVFAQRVDHITADLQALVPAGSTVQVMDDTYANGIQALLRLRLHQSTGFIHDFPLFHDGRDPRIAAIRSEFARRLEAGQPAAIVVSEVTANRSNYDRLQELAPVADRLGKSYTLGTARRWLPDLRA